MDVRAGGQPVFTHPTNPGEDTAAVDAGTRGSGSPRTSGTAAPSSGSGRAARAQQESAGTAVAEFGPLTSWTGRVKR